MEFKIITSIALAILATVIFLVGKQELKPVAIIIFIVIVGFIWVKDAIKMSNNDEYQKALILLGGVGVTIIGWFLTGYFNNENEKVRNRLSIEQSIGQAKRDLRVKFLLDAYFRLENADFRDSTPEGQQPNRFDYIYLKYAESALTSIQLVGSDTLVQLANAYILSGGKQHFDELLKLLRDELRSELNLSKLPNTNDFKPSIYRTYRKLNAPDQLTPEQQMQLTTRLSEFQRELLK